MCMLTWSSIEILDYSVTNKLWLAMPSTTCSTERVSKIEFNSLKDLQFAFLGLY